MKKYIMDELVALFVETQEDLKTDDGYEVLRFMREAITNTVVARNEEESLDELDEEEDLDEKLYTSMVGPF